MDKSSHLVTVPREYLEELESFKESHVKPTNNAQVIFSHGARNAKSTLVVIMDNTERFQRECDRLAICDRDGKEKLSLDFEINL